MSSVQSTGSSWNKSQAMHRISNSASSPSLSCFVYTLSYRITDSISLPLFLSRRVMIQGLWGSVLSVLATVEMVVGRRGSRGIQEMTKGDAMHGMCQQHLKVWGVGTDRYVAGKEQKRLLRSGSSCRCQNVETICGADSCKYYQRKNQTLP